MIDLGCRRGRDGAARDSTRGGTAGGAAPAPMSLTLPLLSDVGSDPTIWVIIFLMPFSTWTVHTISGTSTTRNSPERRTVSTAVTPMFWIHLPIPTWTRSRSVAPR